MAGKIWRGLRNVAVGSTVGAGALYVWDRTFNRSAMSRTAYAVYWAARVGIDYKLHFSEGNDIDALHNRSAHRLYNVIVQNKGLYVKMGQSIAVQGSLLPKPFRVLLSQLFDDAPQDTWEECLETLRSELGAEPEEVFERINHDAVASASIAQVHEAWLPSGEKVAVKIQHADIPTSTRWDLGTYKALMWIYDKYVFKMPMYFVAKYIADQVQQETDFSIELRNAQTMDTLVRNDPEMKNNVYIPRLYPELSTSRVLVMEWIDGVSLTKPDVVKSQFDVKHALTTVFKILTKEAFEWGVVNSDPHPGNWILRHVNGRQQLVMLDHGLYVYMEEKLRMEYAQLWRAMFRRNMPEITRITTEWGFGDPELFASATMLQPYDEESMSSDSFQDREKQALRLKSFLKDTERVPLALVFVGRTQRILQVLNHSYGSPVNRMHLLVDEALRVPASSSEKSLTLRGSWNTPLLYRVIDWFYRRLLLLGTDLIFLSLRLQQFFTKKDPEAAFDQTIRASSSSMLKG